MQFLFEFAQRLYTVSQEVKENSGIERTWSGAHHHSVERSEAHSCLDGLAGLNRTEGATAAEVSDHNL